MFLFGGSLGVVDDIVEALAAGASVILVLIRTPNRALRRNDILLDYFFRHGGVECRRALGVLSASVYHVTFKGRFGRTRDGC